GDVRQHQVADVGDHALLRHRLEVAVGEPDIGDRGMLEPGHVQRTPRAPDPDVPDVDGAYPRGARTAAALTAVQVAADELALQLAHVHVLDVDVLHVATAGCVGLDVQAVPEVRGADPAAAHVHVAHPAGQLAADGERAVLHQHGAVLDDHVP